MRRCGREKLDQGIIQKVAKRPHNVQVADIKLQHENSQWLTFAMKCIYNPHFTIQSKFHYGSGYIEKNS